MNVLGLASYPVDAAATRYRLTQFVEPLRERGIRLTVRPFLDSRTFIDFYRRSALLSTTAGLARALPKRFDDAIRRSAQADVLLVQREAILFGPPVTEWLAMHMGRRPLVLDLDDATYVPYVGATYGKLGRLLKWPSKTDTLIRWATVVTCGSEAISAHASSVGKPAYVLPTVVNTDRFRPRAMEPNRRGPPVLGWVGSHSTFPYLLSLAPVLAELAQRHPYRLRVVGSGRESVRFDGVDVETLDWNLERETADFQSIDIGLYPLLEDAWSVGKSGLKSIQYLAVGIPYVASPVGGAAKIGEPGVTHFCARSADDWLKALGSLIADPDLRRKMGQAGRRHALRHYTVGQAADRLADALYHAADGTVPDTPVISGWPAD
jgi:glycosyltransferase involved in cell wall biosynthesis